MSVTRAIAPSRSVFEGLRDFDCGQVFLPDDPGYHAARRVWNGDADRRPGAIVRCFDVEGVQKTVRYAAKNGIKQIGVRGGGHSYAGLSTCDDGLILDMRLMRGVRAGQHGQVFAQGGALLKDLDALTHELGTAVPSGVISHTGVAGLTLGGGVGYHSRRWGLGIDSMTSVQLVTAAGEVVEVTGDREPELLWGLSGGGGNFGIATEIGFQTYDLGPVLAGITLFPLDRIHEVGGLYSDFALASPRELSATLIPRLPLPPQNPFGLNAGSYCGVATVWSGDLDAGNAVIEPLRQLKPVLQAVGPQAFKDVQSSQDFGEVHYLKRYTRGRYLDSVPGELVDSLAQRLEAAPFTPHIYFVPIGGKVADVGEQDTAYSWRRSNFIFELRLPWDDLTTRAEVLQWGRETTAIVDRFANGGNYVNMLTDEVGSDEDWVAGTPAPTDRVEQLYGAGKFERLRRLKSEWDPENLFSLNQNIPPL
jgi:FAD/FMN-containing dehydrogenase